MAIGGESNQQLLGGGTVALPVVHGIVLHKVETYRCHILILTVRLVQRCSKVWVQYNLYVIIIIIIIKREPFTYHIEVDEGALVSWAFVQGAVLSNIVLPGAMEVIGHHVEVVQDTGVKHYKQNMSGILSRAGKSSLSIPHPPDYN